MSYGDGSGTPALRRLALAVVAMVGVAVVVAALDWGRHEATLRARAYPTPPTNCTSEAECAEKALKVQAREAATAEAALEVAIFQLALSLAGVIAVGFTIFYAHRAWEEAERSAKAATASIDHLKLIERAYVYASIAPADLKTSDQKTVDIDLKVSNLGKTPARIKKVEFGVFRQISGDLIGYPTEPDYTGATVLATDTVLAAEESGPLLTMGDSPLRGLFYAQIHYEDVFARKHVSRCFMKYDMVAKFVVTEPSDAWNLCD